MSAIILRRRKLGRGSAAGITKFSEKGIYQVRNWVDNDVPAGADKHGYVFRWGCTSNLPVVFSDRTVVNDAKAIHWCSDKKQGRFDMQEAGVPVPKTWTVDAFRADYMRQLIGMNGEKYVLRRARHAQGRDLWHGTGDVIINAVRAHNVQDGYISELIDKVAEYRVFVAQNRVAWVAKKTPGNPDQVAWNVAQGGRFDNVRWDEWPKAVVQAALAAAKVGGIDFGGVDVMVDADGNPYVLEVNSAPSQTSEYRQSCVAKAFDYIVENGKTPFDDVPDSPRRTYKSYIHPAVRGNAD